MPQLSYDEAWFLDAIKAVEETVGQLDDRARVLMELSMRLALQGHSAGLIEVMA